MSAKLLWPLRIRERGDVRCQTCGKVHDMYEAERGYASWEDPDDGHVYNRQSWETVARRYGFTEEAERAA
jgi:hypothetical protein